jgi:hypothetical protein
MDWVSVRGGFGRQALSMSAMAAVQLPWQSSRDERMPPLRIPGKAQYLVRCVCMFVCVCVLQRA